MRIDAIKRHVRDVFSGNLVIEWTGVTGMPVRFIMDEVKRRLGGEDKLRTVDDIALDSLDSSDIPPMYLTVRVWEFAMSEMSIDKVKIMVIRAKEDLDAEGKLQYNWKAAKQMKVRQTD